MPTRKAKRIADAAEMIVDGYAVLSGVAAENIDVKVPNAGWLAKVRATATGPISLKATFTPGDMKFFKVGVSDKW